MSVHPISPAEIVDIKLTSIPDKFIEAVNEMITKKWNGFSSRFKQSELLDLYVSKVSATKEPDVARKEAFDNHWLDFEDIYRKQGWAVEYDKPGYNESYEATFEFKKKK